MDFLIGLASIWAILWTVMAVLLISIAVESELGWGALIILCASVLTPWLLGFGGPIQWSAANPGQLVGLAVLYAVVGILWSLIKWRIYVYHHSTKALEQYNQYYSTRENYANIPGDTEVSSSTYNDFLNSDSNPLHPSRHKDRILLWMAWWPFSVLSTFLRDFVSGVWRGIYSLTESTFVAIMRSGTKEK